MLVEGDAFFGFIGAGGLDPWLPGAHAQNETVVRAAAAATAVLAREYDTVFDGVVGPWFLPTFVDAGGFVELDYVVLLPTVERCVGRVRSRPAHRFGDEAATRKMHAEFDAAAMPPRHVIDNSDADADDTLRLVLAARSSGALRHRGT